MCIGMSAGFCQNAPTHCRIRTNRIHKKKTDKMMETQEVRYALCVCA